MSRKAWSDSEKQDPGSSSSSLGTGEPRLGKDGETGYTARVNAQTGKFWSAAIFLRHNPLAEAAFVVITEDLGISGYGIARKLDKNPALVQEALTLLKERRLISGSGDLRDNYTVTAFGFGAKEVLVS